MFIISKILFALAAVAALIFLASPTTLANDVIVGGSTTGNCVPFGNCLGYQGEYQQVYDSSAFSGPVSITQIAFASGVPSPFGGGGPTTYDIRLSLSTTTGPPNGLSTDYASNFGADNTLVFAGVQTVVLSVNNTAPDFDLIFSLTTPFGYDPSRGNLLLDVYMNTPSTGPLNYIRAGTDPLSSRVYNYGGTGAATADNLSLLTRFKISQNSAVPEPATLLLLGIGLAGIGGMIRRRCQSK